MRRPLPPSFALPFLALPLLALPVACGPSPDGPAGHVDLSVVAPGERGEAIINGGGCEEPGTETAVAVLVDAAVSFGGGEDYEIKNVVCTGTLIAPDVVLTAAHCLDVSVMTFGFGEVKSERYFITFQEDLSALSQQTTTEFPADAVEAADWVVHENFNIELFSGDNVNGPGNFHDVGLIFLSQTVETVKPELVLTPAEGELAVVEGTEVVIAGWGQQVQTEGPLDPPPEGSVGIKRCGASFINEVGSHEIQVGGDASTTRKCHGDSGGPTYVVLDTEHTRDRRVIGITSHAYDVEDCNKGGVDTRADAWFDWLDERMTEACDDGTRAWCDVEGVIPASFYDPPSDADKKDDDDVTPPPVCRCVTGDSETAPPSLALLAFGALALLVRRRRR